MADWLTGKKTYITLLLAMLLSFGAKHNIDFGGITADALFTTLEPVLLALAAMFKMAADNRNALIQAKQEKDLTIVRLSK
jgi:hypothetical protein